MAIMDEVNRNANTSTEVLEYSAYFSTISTAGTEVIDELTVSESGSPAKRLKTFVPPDMKTISDPVISRFITKIQVHLNHSAEVIVGDQAIIFLINSNIVDVQEDHTTIWFAMGDIMKKLVSHGAVLDNLDLYFLMKEAREAHILTLNIKTSVDDAMTQAMSTAAKVGSVSMTLTQILTPGSGGRLDSMHHDLNMGDQNIGVLQQTLTGLCNLVGTSEQTMHYLYQHDAAHLIKDSLIISPRNDFYVQLSTLPAELYGLWQLTEGGGLNKVVV